MGERRPSRGLRGHRRIPLHPRGHRRPRITRTRRCDGMAGRHRIRREGRPQQPRDLGLPGRHARGRGGPRSGIPRVSHDGHHARRQRIGVLRQGFGGGRVPRRTRRSPGGPPRTDAPGDPRRCREEQGALHPRMGPHRGRRGRSHVRLLRRQGLEELLRETERMRE